MKDQSIKTLSASDKQTEKETITEEEETKSESDKERFHKEKRKFTMLSVSIKFCIGKMTI